MWRCINRLKNGTKYCKDSPTVPEEALHTAIMKGLSEILYGDDDLHFKEELKQDIIDGKITVPTTLGDNAMSPDDVQALIDSAKLS